MARRGVYTFCGSVLSSVCWNPFSMLQHLLTFQYVFCLFNCTYDNCLNCQKKANQKLYVLNFIKCKLLILYNVLETWQILGLWDHCTRFPRPYSFQIQLGRQHYVSKFKHPFNFMLYWDVYDTLNFPLADRRRNIFLYIVNLWYHCKWGISNSSSVSFKLCWVGWFALLTSIKS